MKFLFVHSWQGFCLAEWYLREAIGNHCRIHTDIRAVDVPVSGIPANDILERIVFSWEPDVIGFSCHYWSLSFFLDVSLWIKKINPHILIVLGGPQVNSENAANSIMGKNRSIDYIIRGPGEEPICRLIESISKKISHKSVPGLSFRDQGLIVHNDPSKIRWKRDLIFHQGNMILNDSVSGLNEISYETTKGCYYNCTYCYYPADKFEILEDERILAELNYICNLNIRNLRICDTHFGGTRVRAKKLLRHLKKINQNTSVKIYPDLNHIDNEYLQLIRESGAQITSIGIQSTNPEALRTIDRHPSHQLQKQIKMVLNEFPDVPADLIVGLPGDSIRGLEKSFKDILLLGFSAVNIFRLMIFPGTELAENLTNYFEDKKLLISHQGNLVCSADFPRIDQKQISCLIYALEIICWVVRNGTLNLSADERVRKFNNLVSRLNADQIIGLYQNIKQGFYPQNEERITRTWNTFRVMFREYDI